MLNLNSNLIFTIKEIVNGIVFTLTFFIIMKKLGYKYNGKNIFYKLANLPLILLITIVKSPFYTSLKGLFILIIALVFIFRFSYTFNWKKSFFYSTIYNLLYMVTESILHYILLYTYLFLIDNFNLNNEFDFQVIELIVINLFILIFIYKFDKIKNIHTNTKYYLYIAITVVTNSLIILFLNIATNSIYDFYSVVVDNKINYKYNAGFMPFVNFADFLLPYIIVAINVIFISIFINLIKSARENAKIKVMNEKLDLQYNYYLIVQESQEKLRNLHHDMNNHMGNIKVLQNDNEDVNKYIDSINDEMEYFEKIYNTGNLLLDTILNEKSKTCKKNNIDFRFDINFSKCNFIDMIDISSIFTNLLDNSIEACNKIDNKTHKKYINIRGTVVKKYYVLKCENSKINKVIIKNNKFLTSKKDNYLHGIGIQSIKSSLKKYDGELEINTDEEKFIATIYIPI